MGFLNKEVIQIAGYNIHVSFFLLIALLIGVVAFIILTLNKKQYAGETSRKKFDRIKITDWQRSNIGKFLMDERDEFVKGNDGEIDKDSGEKHVYVHLLDEFYNYLKKESLWDVNKLMNIDENFLLVFNSILMDESRKRYIDNDPNSALLLAHSIDLMNGGNYLFNNSDEWLGSDVNEMMQHEGMDVQEGRLFTKSINAIYSLAGIMYNADGIRRANLPEYLDHITVEELDKAYFELESSTSFINLSEVSYDVLVYAFYNEIDGYLKRLTTGDKLKEFQLYDVRCLCSALDYSHETYDYILDTIE